MAVVELNEAPSRRLFRAYMAMWGVAAIVAVGYLGTLAWQPEQLAPVATESRGAGARHSSRCRGAGRGRHGASGRRLPAKGRRRPQGQRRAAQRSRQDAAVAGCSARGTRGIAAEQRDHHDARQRLVRQAEGAEAKGNEPKAAEKVEPKAVEKAETKAVEKPQAKAPAKGAAQKAGSTPASGSKTSIETGSITQPQIVFGEAVVTRAEQLYAVQLDTATSLDALRTRWGLLVERNGSTLATLQPRYVAPCQGWTLPPAGRSPDQPRRCPRHLRRAARPAAVLQHHRLRRRTAVADCISPSCASKAKRAFDAGGGNETCRRGLRALATRVGDGRRSSLQLSDLSEKAADVLRSAGAYVSDLMTPTLRLGVTGLARSGKTVFITALVRSLVSGGRLPYFAAMAEGRIVRAYLEPQPDDTLPRFAYEEHLAALAADPPQWPESTRRISQLRVTVEYSAGHAPQAHAGHRAAAHRHRRLSGRVAARPAAAGTRLRRVVGAGARRGAVARARGCGARLAVVSRRPSIRRRRPMSRRR